MGGGRRCDESVFYTWGVRESARTGGMGGGWCDEMSIR